jgi:hypothetical protein
MFTLSRKTWLQTAAVAVAFAVIQPGLLSAQNSGVAGDGTMRLMWKGTDSRISLWKLDASNGINFLSAKEHGPFYGWEPIALTTANNRNSYVLWRHTNGAISLWLVDANLNYVTHRQYGPYEGWTAESLSVETIGGVNKDRFRVIWRATNGQVSLWIVDANLNFVNNHVHGPYWGWVPSAGKAATAPTAADAEAEAKAAAAMTTPPSSPSRMPGQ